VIQAGYREVVDGTEAVTAVHINHDYKLADVKGSVAGGQLVGGASTFWM